MKKIVFSISKFSMATNVFAPNWEDILIKQLDTKLTALPQPTTPPVQP